MTLSTHNSRCRVPPLPPFFAAANDRGGHPVAKAATQSPPTRLRKAPPLLTTDPSPPPPPPPTTRARPAAEFNTRVRTPAAVAHTHTRAACDDRHRRGTACDAHCAVFGRRGVRQSCPANATRQNRGLVDPGTDEREGSVAPR